MRVFSVFFVPDCPTWGSMGIGTIIGGRSLRHTTIPLLSAILALAIIGCRPGSNFSLSEKIKDSARVARDFRHADTDKDDRLSQSEWKKRGNFERLDKNGDGYLNLREVRALYDGHDNRNYVRSPVNKKMPATKIDPTIQNDRVIEGKLNEETICGIGRARRYRSCDVYSQITRGLLATGTGPRFPNNARCPSIDDYWAMDYSFKRPRQSYHGGIDVPVPWGTFMRAVAAGSVVAIYRAHQSKRGIELVLRHSPQQTGLSIWTYSAYGHMDAIPKFEIGQRVAMGEVLGPTGNSGISGRGGGQSKMRRPAIHLAMFYSDNRKYSESNDTIIPVNGYWLDPMAFFRRKGPFDSLSVKQLADDEKFVTIPVMFEDGTLEPADTKVVWPYACERD